MTLEPILTAMYIDFVVSVMAHKDVPGSLLSVRFT